MPVNIEEIKHHKAPPPVSDINVTPMVDVMLVMLIIFMVITPMLSKGVSVDLVKTKNPISMQAQDKSDAITCSVTRDGRTYLNTTQMKPEDMPPKVKDMLSNRLDKTVFVKADSDRKSTRLNSSHLVISYAVFCLQKKHPSICIQRSYLGAA